MKYLKIVSVIVSLCMMLCLCACGTDASAEPTAAPTEADSDTATEVATEVATETPTELPVGYVTYTVRVTDTDGTGFSGLVLQVCNDEVCMLYEADDSGASSFTVEEDEYSVKLIKKPDGYIVEDEYLFDGDAKELTIVLEKAE